MLRFSSRDAIHRLSVVNNLRQATPSSAVQRRLAARYVRAMAKDSLQEAAGKGGAFERTASTFRSRIEKDGEFKPEGVPDAQAVVPGVMAYWKGPACVHVSAQGLHFVHRGEQEQRSCLIQQIFSNDLSLLRSVLSGADEPWRRLSGHVVSFHV